MLQFRWSAALSVEFSPLSLISLFFEPTLYECVRACSKINVSSSSPPPPPPPAFDSFEKTKQLVTLQHFSPFYPALFFLLGINL